MGRDMGKRYGEGGEKVRRREGGVEGRRERADIGRREG